MSNRAHLRILAVETDMANRADALNAVDDLEALVLLKARKPVMTLDDIDRMLEDLRAIRAGLEAVRKYLMEQRQGEPMAREGRCLQG